MTVVFGRQSLTLVARNLGGDGMIFKENKYVTVRMLRFVGHLIDAGVYICSIVWMVLMWPILKTSRGMVIIPAVMVIIILFSLLYLTRSASDRFEKKKLTEENHLSEHLCFTSVFSDYAFVLIWLTVTASTLLLELEWYIKILPWVLLPSMLKDFLHALSATLFVSETQPRVSAESYMENTEQGNGSRQR